MQFSALRMTGFKSFLEATELEIGQGLTGIVGPNGCGKSNLVEALRWVMGESSAKKMRGGEMDDVIFGGSDRRPARNLAEVSLLIENNDRALTPQFNGAEQLEIVRRIERGAGSDYRVNGKSVRAKDVALLFQDNGTGPHSASLVSQGRIGALIAAKPTEKRLLLEEAAGITGLHTRRHEAELRLKQAEANLLRVEDVMGTMDAQLQLLKKQARQASRYRNINAELRRQDAALLHLKWVALRVQLEDATQAFATADARVGSLMLEVARLENARLAAADALAPLRQEEAAAGAALQRLTLAREQVEADAARVEAALQAARQRIHQGQTDRAREAALAEDARRAMEGIDAETTALTAAENESDSRRDALLRRVEETVALRDQAEQKVAALQKQVALAEAEAAAAQRRKADLTARQERTAARLAQSAAERAGLEAASPGGSTSLQAAEAAVQESESALNAAQAAIEAGESRRTTADSAVAAARERVQHAQSLVNGLSAERTGIERILAASQGDHPPVLDTVVARRGYEQALAVALGDDLALPLDPSAPVYWQTLPAFADPPAFPPGVRPLSGFITAPDALARRLALVGVVDAEAEADLLQPGLHPGQCLVSAEGAAWRWDGVRLKAGAPTAAALRLQQRNRLREIEAELAEATPELEAARAALATALMTATSAEADIRTARTAHTHALEAVTRARRAASEVERELAAHAARLERVREAEARLIAEQEVLTAEGREVEVIQAALPDLFTARAELTEVRLALATCQADAADAEATRRQFEREHTQRTDRLATLRTEKERWLTRSAGADERLAELAHRIREAEEACAELTDKPTQLQAQRAHLVEEVEAAACARTAAADRLAQAETALKEQERALRQAEAETTDSREARATAQAETRALQEAQTTLSDRITEKCACAPEGLRALAGFEDGKPLPEPESVEGRIEKILRERDALGPVNLRAEQEAEDQQTQIDTLQREKADLAEAIAKLRHGISSLNREARERLVDAFGKVQEHFARLFTQLFGGGVASLKLTDADDPLEAGLEVIASPPGKKLQNLSLLSGGEQALTSLALLFAVFLVNPSPICVLDEVDAPLDEANSDRFCTLLDHMVREGTTRFLVITHQRLTMSRMDRLYGVTMMEKGVSKLVSVDLNAAEDLKEGLLAA